MKWFPARRWKLRKSGEYLLHEVLLICKEIALSELNLLYFAYHYSRVRLFPVLPLAGSLIASNKPVYATAKP